MATNIKRTIVIPKPACWNAKGKPTTPEPIILFVFSFNYHKYIIKLENYLLIKLKLVPNKLLLEQEWGHFFGFSFYNNLKISRFD